MEELEIKDFSGYITSTYAFGRHRSTCNNLCCTLKPGVNLLQGSIDSGGWAISYALSMYKPAFKKDFVILPGETTFFFGGNEIALDAIPPMAVYLDRAEPLFRSKKTVRQLVEQGLKKSKISKTADEIRDLFSITPFRFEYQTKAVGNERFKCMAAIGYAWGKELFCFPWFSKILVPYYGRNLTDLLKTLKALQKTAVFPTEFCFSNESFFTTKYMFDKNRLLDFELE